MADKREDWEHALTDGPGEAEESVSGAALSSGGAVSGDQTGTQVLGHASGPAQSRPAGQASGQASGRALDRVSGQASSQVDADGSGTEAAAVAEAGRLRLRVAELEASSHRKPPATHFSHRPHRVNRADP